MRTSLFSLAAVLGCASAAQPRPRELFGRWRKSSNTCACPRPDTAPVTVTNTFTVPGQVTVTHTYTAPASTVFVTITDRERPVQQITVTVGGTVTETVPAVTETKTLPGGAVTETKILPGGTVTETRTLPGGGVVTETRTLPGETVTETRTSPGGATVTETKTLPGSEAITETKTLPGGVTITETRTLPGGETVTETRTVPATTVPTVTRPHGHYCHRRTCYNSHGDPVTTLPPDTTDCSARVSMLISTVFTTYTQTVWSSPVPTVVPREILVGKVVNIGNVGLL
ncbi:hypothetical protein MAPG_04898 [Magnaporthiopsis poae ATCC 64411]|uniref:Uncharacterized protein n=1 Tax=Magnaporthiopsis poae (strain ATCC 64411 / 73-15) TaxID=644358 RepID=A0A0C4DXZ1_MAGP6|nr:hypothetical protein MAPG_04898 [Magnaporthiopsis poae ATCC 64411]